MFLLAGSDLLDGFIGSFYLLVLFGWFCFIDWFYYLVLLVGSFG